MLMAIPHMFVHQTLILSMLNLRIQVSSSCIKNKDNVKLLGIHINNSFNFDYHVNQQCEKASKKLHALARVAKYTDINKRKTLMDVHYLLIWTFQSRKKEHWINNIQKKALKLVSQNSHDLTFNDLLAKDKSVSVYQKNLRLLATVIFKSKTGMSSELMNHIFHFVQRPNNLRSKYTLERKRGYTVYDGSENLSFLVPKLWDLLPNSKKTSASFKGTENKN